ncbi:hypothetical protein ABHF33_09875 [Chitinibacter sp. FCG-7]|uniref:Polysaccharide biosynthesis protein n=1 Tax=Chitinibacter mangrovi TaxID=3153927 RepID=A0AAU7F6I4_9NEIS
MKSLLKAVAGNGGASLANLAFGLVLLKVLSVEEYGVFAFYVVLQGLGFAISNAVFGSPLLKYSDFNDESLKVFCNVNLIYTLFFALLVFLTAYFMLDDLYSASVLALTCVFSLFRWFLRLYYANFERHEPVFYCDLIYFFMVMGFALLIFAVASDNFQFACLGLLLPVFFSMFSFDLRLLRHHFDFTNLKHFDLFKRGFKSQGKHSLQGVIATEVVSSGHSYALAVFFGPAAFAPIAFLQLFFRPVGVVLTAISQIKRPVVAKKMRDKESCCTELKQGFILSSAFFLVNFIFAAIVIFYFINAFENKFKLDSGVLIFSFLLIALSSTLKVFRNSSSILLQAADQFRYLARSTLLSAVLCISLVGLMIYLKEPYLTLIPIVLADFLLYLLMRNRAKKYVN